MAQLKDLLVNGKSKFLDIITATGIRLASGGSDTVFWNTNGGTKTASEIVIAGGDGRYLRWAGNKADTAAQTWGTLTTANGYTPLSHASSSDGGDMNWANKDGKISMQLDGYFYQNEGQYRVADTSDLAKYLPLAGGTMSGTIKRTYTSSSTPFIHIISDNYDNIIWRVGYSSYSAMSGDYGFTLQYNGSGSGVDNRLRLYADNQQSSQVTAISINQSGQVGIGTDSDTNYRVKVNGATNISSGLLSITNNGNTLTMGAQNASYCHFKILGDAKFYFNKTLHVDGDILPYTYSSTNRNLGNSSYVWNSLYVKDATITNGITKNTGGTTLSLWNTAGSTTSITTTIGNSPSDANIPTEKAVADKLASAMTSVLKYKGTIGTGGTTTSLPTDTSAGWVYVVKTKGTYAGQACEPGDYILCQTTTTSATNADWDVVNGENQIVNDTLTWTLAAPGSNVNTSVGTVDGTDLTLKLQTPSTWKVTDNNTTYTFKADSPITVTTSGTDTVTVTISHATQTSYSAKGTTTKVPQITTNATGHVTTITEKDIAFPSGYGKITTANSTVTSSLTGNTSLTTASSANENIKFSGANKWVVLAATNSTTAGSDEIKFGHVLNGIGAGTATGTAATLTWNGTFTIPKVGFDEAGHVTSTGSVTMTMPGNPNTDYRVQLDITTTDSFRPLLAANKSSSAAPSDTGSVTNIAYFENKLYSLPATGNIYTHGSIRVGASTTVSGGAMEYDSTERCIKFSFV